MKRRDLMLLSTRALACAGGQQFFSSWMQAAAQSHTEHGSRAPAEPDRWSSYEAKFFSQADFAMLNTFCEILIPSDETPGAREAHVAHYIDFVVHAAAEHAPQVQAEWRTAMAWLAAQDFDKMKPAQQLALIQRMSAPERDAALKHDGFATYRLIKQQAVFAFYTSRSGLIDNLEYKGNAYLAEFPGCTHPEHRRV